VLVIEFDSVKQHMSLPPIFPIFPPRQAGGRSQSCPNPARDYSLLALSHWLEWRWGNFFGDWAYAHGSARK